MSDSTKKYQLQGFGHGVFKQFPGPFMKGKLPKDQMQMESPILNTLLHSGSSEFAYLFPHRRMKNSENKLAWSEQHNANVVIK